MPTLQIVFINVDGVCQRFKCVFVKVDSRCNVSLSYVCFGDEDLIPLIPVANVC